MVKINRGMTDYPGFGPAPVAEAEVHSGAGASGSLRNEVRATSGEHVAEPAATSNDEREIQELLDKARSEFQEYLRLKAQKKPPS